jgi:hypothetical protein
MNDQKIVDCVKWKHDLYEKAYKTSGARNFAEYIDFVNAAVKKSPLHKEPENTPVLSLPPV